MPDTMTKPAAVTARGIAASSSNLIARVVRKPIDPIEAKYQSLGGASSFLGAATSDVQKTPDGIGRYRHFRGGSIYWSPTTGTHEIHGAIRDKWAALGWERSFLGYPTTDETPTPDHTGRYNHFQGGSIYWSPSTGAFEIHGDIRGKWAALGWERSFLGYPTTDETTTPDGIGRYNHFQGGSIYWTPNTGACEVHGAIRDRWAALGWERSYLGYPISDEADFDGGRVSTFQNGAIYWWPETGAIDLRDVVVHYTGLMCFGETDWDQGSNSDEPYAIIGVVSPSWSGTLQTRIYDDVDSGESRPDLMEIYRGMPAGISINMALMEHDFGDPNKYKQAVEVAVQQASVGATTLLTLVPGVGPVLGPACGAILGALKGTIADALNDLLGTGDDALGTAQIHLSPKTMVVLAARTSNSTFKGIGFKADSDLFTGEGASYKLYFGVVPA